MHPGSRCWNRPLACLALLSTFLLVCPIARGQESGDVPAKLAAYMQAQANDFSGAALVQKDGKPLLRQGYGMANYELRVPNEPETRFRLGSITKSFTAMAVMILQERGKLSVDDLVSKHLAETPEAWKDITIRHLLTHTSGIPSFTGFDDYEARKREHSTVDQLLARFRDKPLEFAPGERFEYSNSGYVVLGALVEAGSGQTYETFLRQAVLDPLELNDTGYDHAETLIEGRASGYVPGADGKPRNADFLDMSIPFSAGALYSTVDDMSRWAAAIETGKLVSKEAHEAMITPAKDGYAFGWVVSEKDGRNRIGHGGGIDGFATSLTFYPQDDLRVVVLSNRIGSNPGQIADDLVHIVFGEPYTPPQRRAEIAVASEVLDSYVGRYQIVPEFIMDVAHGPDGLSVQATGQARTPLFAESETVFFPKVIDATIEFVKDDAGQVTALILHQAGRHTRAERLPVEVKDEAQQATTPSP